MKVTFNNDDIRLSQMTRVHSCFLSDKYENGVDKLPVGQRRVKVYYGMLAFEGTIDEFALIGAPVKDIEQELYAAQFEADSAQDPE